MAAGDPEAAADLTALLSRSNLPGNAVSALDAGPEHVR